MSTNMLNDFISEVSKMEKMSESPYVVRLYGICEEKKILI